MNNKGKVIEDTSLSLLPYCFIVKISTVSVVECLVDMKPVLWDAARKHMGFLIDPDRNYQYYQPTDLQDYLKIDM